MVEYIHQHPTARAEDAVRDALSRTERDGRVVRTGEKLQRVGQRGEPPGDLPAETGARRTEHLVRYPCGENGRMPGQVTERAARIPNDMESTPPGQAKDNKKKAPTVAQYGSNGIQLSMFQLDDPVLKQIRDEIRGLDINSLTPLEALNKLE